MTDKGNEAKRLIFCFDGTTNKLTRDDPTNVVLVAASIPPVTPDGTTQIIHYDEGVGTAAFSTATSMAGIGLLDNVREAYSFLVFNYEPGDEIFVFGFSRGGFSGQSFIGLIRYIGIIDRLQAGRIDEGIKLYQARASDPDGTGTAMLKFRAENASRVCIGDYDDAYRVENRPGYVCGSSPPLTIRYAGIWDAVKAIGVPAVLPGSKFINKPWDFHDSRLTHFVESARHALALDERRALFPPEPWTNVDELNRAKGEDTASRDASYQQRWFPGTHTSVGGGGDIRGLSDGALFWVIEGAKRAGLVMDIGAQTRIYSILPDHTAPLVNERNPKFSFTQIVSKERSGPTKMWELSDSTVRRWQDPAGSGSGSKPYRPRTLDRLGDELRGLPPLPPRLTPDQILTVYETVPGDNLSKLAKRFYGNSAFYDLIFQANRHLLDDADEVVPGKTLDIPKRLVAQTPEGAAPAP